MKDMNKFSDLPYELRLCILKTARRNAFKEKILKFETAFAQYKTRWDLKKLDVLNPNQKAWKWIHQTKRIELTIFYHLAPISPNSYVITENYQCSSGDTSYWYSGGKLNNGEWLFTESEPRIFRPNHYICYFTL